MQDAGISPDEEIERLRLRLRQLEVKNSESGFRFRNHSPTFLERTTDPSSEEAAAASAKRKVKQAVMRNKSFDAFAHLSRSTRNLGQRQLSRDTLISRESICSTGGSVSGIFGDSDDDDMYDDSESATDIIGIGLTGAAGRGGRRTDSGNGHNHHQNDRDSPEQQLSHFEMLNTSYSRPSKFMNRRNRSRSFDAAKGSDDDMSPFTTDDEQDDDEFYDLKSSSPKDEFLASPKRHVFQPREPKPVDMRTISMQPQIPRDEFPDASSSSHRRRQQDEAHAIVDEIFQTERLGAEQPARDIVVAERKQQEEQPEEEASPYRQYNLPVADPQVLSTSPPKRISPHPSTSVSDSTGGSSTFGGSNHRRQFSRQRRKSSYDFVKTLSTGPKRQSSAMMPNFDLPSFVELDLFRFETLCPHTFSQFALLQIQPMQLLLLDNEYIFTDDGPAHLDCFLLTQEVELEDHFTASARPIDSAAVNSFCFPDGLRVRYIPRAGIVGAKRMGWLGPKGDKCHILVFTNGHGMADHGVAITIQWEINLKQNERQVLSEAVYCRRKRRRAARTIQSWWRILIQDRVLQSALEISGFPEHSTADLRAELAPSELKLLEKSLRSNMQAQNASGSAAGKQLKRKGIKKKINAVLNRRKQSSSDNVSVSTTSSVEISEVEAVTRAAVLRSPAVTGTSLGLSDSVHTEDQYEVEDIVEESKPPLSNIIKRAGSSDSLRGNNNNNTSSNRSLRSRRNNASGRSLSTSPPPPKQRPKPVDARVREWAKESYETMKENDRMGSICIVQKCYTLIGCQSDEHSLLIGPLQQLINSERNEILAFRRTKDLQSQHIRPKDKPNNDVLEERRLDVELKDRRQIIIKAMREKLRLKMHEALVRYPASQMEHIQGDLHYFEVDIPQIPNSETIKLPLPLPKIGSEWALSQFMLDIGPDSLVLTLKLLLLERSILVLGDDLQSVTMYACALLELLKPFEWASTFIPILPLKMLDFVTSPVPFIAGICARFDEVENDDRVLEAMSNGMSLLNLKTKTLHISTETGIGKLVSLDPYLRETLKSLRARLQRLVRQDPQSPLRNFRIFTNFGLSRRESLTLHSVSRVLEQYFEQLLCGDLATNDRAWKRYGTVSVERPDEFVFVPEWFLNPQLADQSFRESMVHTQLFSGYVHERRNDQLEMQEIMEGEVGQYLADWIYRKWMEKKKRFF